MFFKTTVAALAVLVSGCAHAQSGIDTVESIENPGSLRIFLPMRNEVGYRGSTVERLRDLSEAPAMEVRIFDIQKVLNFIHAESKNRKNNCSVYEREIADAFIIMEAYGGAVNRFSVHKGIAVNMESGECFSLPDFFAKLQEI